MDEIYIFGAGSRSQTLGIYLKKLNPKLKIIAYLVDNDEKNPHSIDEIPVVHLKNTPELDKSKKVYLGTRMIYHKEISKRLKSLGFKKIILNTPALDMELRNKYLELYYSERERSFDKLDNITGNGRRYCTSGSCCIYVIRSALDSTLAEEYEMKPWEKVLQAGAALTNLSISELKDNIGENISDRNKQFCELTALYWIWKNSDEDVVGLEHYRRHFLLPKDWQERMDEAGIDVLLPTPLYVHPSLAENYRARHVSSDLDFVYRYVADNYPKDADTLKTFLENTSLYSPCNMLIARQKVLKNLCHWLFPILFAAAEHIGVRNNQYQNRYPGFLSERLITYYFEQHKDKYKVVYCDKNFLK